MKDNDLGEARRRARENTRLAVRRFARDPSVDSAQNVSQACRRVRMLEEMRHRRHREPDAAS